MGKITSYTNKLLNITSGSQLGTNIPTNSVMRALGVDGTLGLGSIQDISNTIKELHEGISNAATMAYCAYNLFTIKGGLEFLDRLALGMDSAIASILDQVIDAVATQISMAAQQVIGAFTSLLDALANLVQSVLLIADILVDLWKNWTDWSNWKFQLNIEKEETYRLKPRCFLFVLLSLYLLLFTILASSSILSIEQLQYTVSV